MAIIAFLFPGVFFFIGLSTYERLSREIIRSGVISEIALATAVAVILHVVCLSLLSATGFRLSQFVMPFAQYDAHIRPEQVVLVSQRLMPAALYLLATAALGFGLGAITSRGIVSGWLRFLARHKWIYDVVDRDRQGGIVTVFVMTTTIEDGKALMYRGRLHDVFLRPDGKIAYVTLKNCSRYFMSFAGAVPETGDPVDLFAGQNPLRRIWDYLLIDGDNIANILFDPSSETIQATAPGFKALEQALQDIRQRPRTGAQVPDGSSVRRPGPPTNTRPTGLPE